jgi:hypothetical protein
VELEVIIDRYAGGLEAVDRLEITPRTNRKTGEQYLAGIKTMLEPDLVVEIDKWWNITHPSDFNPTTSHGVNVPYPGSTKNRCDHVFTTDGIVESTEWAIEFKLLHLVGNNGKRNDFAPAKALSPFLKDRSLYHDVDRLRTSPIARRRAVIAACFSYSPETCRRALTLHPQHADRVKEILKTCKDNGGRLSVRPLAEFADGILRVRQLVTGSYVVRQFDAWRHPCAGQGAVFGWEVATDQTAEELTDW